MYTASMRENAIAEMADELGISYGEAERRYQQAENAEFDKALRASIERHAPIRRTPRVAEPKTKQPRMLTYKQITKRCKDAGRDWYRDSKSAYEDMEPPIEDAAYDIAESILLDPEVRRAASIHLNTSNHQLMKEILADHVADGAK